MTNLKIAVGIALAWLCLQDPPKDPDLLLHLPFDGGKVDEAVGKTAGKVEWGEGKKGGALKLDGAGGHVQLSNTDALDKVQNESYSLAAWFKPEDVPPGTESDN